MNPQVANSPPVPVANAERDRWMLDPSITFLNHGSFGARLRVVLEAQQAWRDRFERDPITFLDRDRERHLQRARAAVGAFLGMEADAFGFMSNASAGVNAVLRSLSFGQGDEILATNLAYFAVKQTHRFVCERTGAVLKEIAIDTPVRRADDIVEAIEAALTERTRLVLIDHVTSESALVLPVAKIVDRCAAHGVDVLVDGAHAPGMLELDVTSLGAAYYAGNLHKWCGAPPGAAFLWVRGDRRAEIHPLIISHYLGEGFVPEFDWQGTRDISPFLTAPQAIEAVGGLGGDEGWAAVRAHNRALCAWAHGMLRARFGTSPISPADGSMLGSIASVPLPGAPDRRYEQVEHLRDELRDRFAIEVPIMAVNGQWLVRVSAQVYNRPEDYERLADGVMELLG